MMNIDQQQIGERIRSFEAQTGLELMVAVCKRSDPYPAASWRGGLVLTAATLLPLYGFIVGPSAELTTLITLCSVVCWSLFFKWSGLDMWFTSKKEIERETREQAASIFSGFQSEYLSHQLGILLFVSEDEKKLQLLLDKRVSEIVKQQECEEIISALQTAFRANQFTLGMSEAIALLQVKLAGKFPLGTIPNDVPNKVFSF